MCPLNHEAYDGHGELLNGVASASSAEQEHFLIVDDISSMRRVMVSLLKDHARQVRISEVAAGRAALQILQQAETDGAPVDFVISDWNMPQMDGITLLRMIRQMPSMKDLPVLLVTAQASKEIVLDAAHAGADGYIVKPFNAQTLKTKLAQIMAKYARQKARPGSDAAQQANALFA